MSILQAIVLGLVQGLTEFIPISSTGHLTLIPFMVGWKEPTIAFVVAVHLGTLVAVTYIFRDEVLRLIKTVIGYGRATAEDKRLLRLVIIATIPGIVIALIFKAIAGDTFEGPVLVAIELGINGYFLIWAESKSEFHEAEARDESTITTQDSTVIGIAQGAAVLSGISRSGATIGIAMLRGIERRAAARFSFLLSIPIIAGAILDETPKMLKESAHTGAAPFLIGIVFSGVAGFISVRWFIGVLSRRGMRPFGTYCMFAMLAGLLTALARG